ncbi:MAG TPA: hypothetical protein ENN69_04420, partial [Spirochaetia bacterium]|nr:hypothetical protein [Spirochaetia bacterium]
GIFLTALESLGLTPQLRGPDGRPDRGGVCFASASAYEIAVGGRKILGSAQVRRNGVVLQHGSLLLDVDYERHARCMKGRRTISAAYLAAKMAGLFQLLFPFEISILIERIVAVYREVFDSTIIDYSHKE